MKKIMSIILSTVILCVVILTGTVSVFADAIGTLPSNAIQLTDKEWYIRYWTNSNYDAKCYNRIVVPSNGYITFSIEKPVDSEGEIESYYLTLYDSNGDIIWEGHKSASKDIFNSYYEYKIGLEKGTYYMDIDPSFYVYSTSAPIETSYRYVFVETSCFEIETNNSFETATTVSLNKEYSAVIHEGSSDYDYFKVKLTKGEKYTVRFNNYDSDASYTFYDPEESSKYFDKESSFDEWDYGYKTVNGNNMVWTFTATASGYHYIRVYDYADKDIEYSIKVEEITKKKTVKSVKLSASKYTYNGKTKTPTIIAKDSSGKTISSKYYTVTYASGRKNVGKYKVTVKFKGNYSGTVTLYFEITPPKTTVSKVSGAKKSISVTVSKKTSQVSGYQIQYSTSKKFTSAKTKTLSSYKTTKYTIKSLSAKKTYYVRVRTYKTVNGKKYYSGWSSYKNVKTK